ncbi:hypothetical protein D3C76_262050 [compost metagenome]
MSKFELLLVSLLAMGSTSAMAEGGSERSQAFWKEFRATQERIHGSSNVMAGTSKESITEAEIAQEKLAKG